MSLFDRIISFFSSSKVEVTNEIEDVILEKGEEPVTEKEIEAKDDSFDVEKAYEEELKRHRSKIKEYRKVAEKTEEKKEEEQGKEGVPVVEENKSEKRESSKNDDDNDDFETKYDSVFS